MKWRKYTIHTTTAAEDLISNILSELGIESIEIEDNVPLSKEDTMAMFVDILPELPKDEGLAQIHFYLEEDADTDDIMLRIQDGIHELRDFVDTGSGKITESVTEDKDWINNWKEFFKPFTVGNILIKPTWEIVPENEQDKLLIEIDPGTAFGTGMHETTQLCIKQLETYVTKNTVMLDVGTGSGILSIVGLKLGAKKAVGTDLDPNAISAVYENRTANQISEEQFEVMIGNIIEEEELKSKIGFERYDLVTANILADIIIELSKVIDVHLKPNGVFITSGILNTKEQAVKDVLLGNPHFKLLETNYQGDWVSITVQKI